MQQGKIEQLLEFLKEDPNDSFLLYTLALEYVKIEDIKAGFYFDELLNKHPEYLATYYHAGNYFEISNKDKAIKIYQKGMEVASKQGKTKALNEIRAALNMLIDDDF